MQRMVQGVLGRVGCRREKGDNVCVCVCVCVGGWVGGWVCAHVYEAESKGSGFVRFQHKDNAWNAIQAANARQVLHTRGGEGGRWGKQTRNARQLLPGDAQRFRFRVRVWFRDRVRIVCSVQGTRTCLSSAVLRYVCLCLQVVFPGAERPLIVKWAVENERHRRRREDRQHAGERGGV